MRPLFVGVRLGLLLQLLWTIPAFAAENIDLHGNDTNLVDRLNRGGIYKEPGASGVEGRGGEKKYLHSLQGSFLDLGPRDSFQAYRERIDRSNMRHTRYRQMYKGIPIFGKEIVLHEDQAGRIKNINGNMVKGIDNDIDPDLPLIPGMSPADAFERGKNITARNYRNGRQRSGPGKFFPESGSAPASADGKISFRNERSELTIYIDDKNKPRLAYYLSFVMEAEGGEPGRPNLIMDAVTGELLKQWDGLAYVGIGTGPGGNEKVGQYEYGVNYGFLDVFQNTSQCVMQNVNVRTVDMTGMPDAFADAFGYVCPRNTVKTVNGAYSPLNDAHYFGGAIVDMYGNWYGVAPIPLPLVMRTHYGTNYENAFWDGQYMTFGDGASSFYPLVSLDIAAHEVSHGFTEFNSGLIYEKESGGINESFSDMAGEAAEYFLRGSNDWKVGADIKKGTGALRYMDNPPADGTSIADYSLYTDSMDVHYSSGIFNKAFYLLATKPGWNTKKAFDVMVKADMDYWVPAGTFRSAACGAINAATDLSYNAADVDNAFMAVNVYCGAPDIAVTIFPPAVAMTGNYTFANTAGIFSQNFTASAGVPPYTWSVKSGSLPPGSVLSPSTGVLSGTLSTNGRYSFTLEVTDALGRKNFKLWTILVDSALRSGWPKELKERAGTGWLSPSYSPVISDLNGDGKEEIIVGDGNTLYVLSADGTSRSIVLPGSLTTPAVADLDGDGTKEIILSVGYYYGSSNTLYAFHADLSPVTGFPAGAYENSTGGPGEVTSPVVGDFNNDGQMKIFVIAGPNYTYDPNYDKNVGIMVDAHGTMVPGWPKVFGTYNWEDTPPAVGDLDHDGREELVHASMDGYVRVFSADGAQLSQWPFGQSITKCWSPVLADVDGDGFPDVVLRYIGSGQTYLTVFNRNGSVLAGWPKIFSSAALIGPTTADVDGDGRPEILDVSGSYWNTLNALKGDGSPLPGWPVVFSTNTLDYADAGCHPVVADMDGDGKQEVFITAQDFSKNGKVYGYSANGILLSGFPKYASPAAQNRTTAALGDLDGNGRPDLVVKSENGFLYAWEMNSNSGGKKAQWPMWRNDPQHLGRWSLTALEPPPVITISGAPTGITRSPSAALTVGGAIVAYKYKLDAGAYTAEIPINTGINLYFLSDGPHRVTVIGKDAGGTWWSANPVAVSWVVDITPPVTTAVPDAMYQSISLSCNDNGGSGCAGTYYCLGTGCTPDLPYQAPINAGAFTSIGFYSVDAVGNNEASKTYQVTYPLTVSETGTGSGTVSGSGISCTTGDSYGCSAFFVSGTVVTLTATPAPDSTFAGWSGGCTSIVDNRCTVTVSGSANVTAEFSYVPLVTALSVDPANPDGANGWYVTAPIVTLAPNRQGTTYYRWGSPSDYIYARENSSWIPDGSPLRIMGDDTGAWYYLPFSFTFYGTPYTGVYVSSNGLLRFDAADISFSNSAANLRTKAAIAPLWDDLITGRSVGDDIYLLQPDQDSIGFRWQAQTYSGSYQTYFEAVLYRNGNIRLNYAVQGGGLTPTIGISKGDGKNFHTAYDNDLSTTNGMASILYTPNPDPWQTYNAAIIPVDGIDTFNYYTKDIEGVVEQVNSLNIKVDTAAPVTNTSTAGGSYSVPQNVTLSCNDGSAGSGCSTTRYCLGTGCSPTTPYEGEISIPSSTDLRFYSTDIAGNAEALKTVTYNILVAGHAVNLTIEGTGSGLVASAPSGLSCSGNCSVGFPGGSTVTLSATPSEYSLFTGWSGACTGTGNCVLSMTSDRFVTAQFALDTIHRVKIDDGTFFSTIQAAYAGAANGNTLMLWGVDFTENVILDVDKEVIVSGGYDQQYLHRDGAARIHGGLTIGKGVVTVEGVEIGP